MSDNEEKKPDPLKDVTTSYISIDEYNRQMLNDILAKANRGKARIFFALCANREGDLIHIEHAELERKFLINALENVVKDLKKGKGGLILPFN
jgi:hypothetical protein